MWLVTAGAQATNHHSGDGAGACLARCPSTFSRCWEFRWCMWRSPTAALIPRRWRGFISSYYEYHFLYITGIKEVESRSIEGVSLVKQVFYSGTNMSQAVAETVAQGQPRASLHAARHGRAFRGAFRRGQRAVRQSGLFERNTSAGRDTRFGAVQGAPDVGLLAGRIRSAADGMYADIIWPVTRVGGGLQYPSKQWRRPPRKPS